MSGSQGVLETARAAPGPWAPPVLGAAGHFMGDPLKRFMELSARFGPIVSLGPMGGVPFYLLTGPELNKHVLLDNNKNYKKGRAAQSMKAAFGMGSLLLEGQSWLVRRRLLQPAFHRQKIAAHATAFVEAGEQLLRKWQGAAARGEAIDVRPDTLRMTMQLTLKNLFHVDIAGDIKELVACWQDIYEFMSENRFSPIRLPAWVQTPKRKRFAEARAVVDRVLYRLIAERRAAGDDDGSMLSMLIAAKDAETGETMDDEQVRNELMILFVGGYETSSNCLAFTFGLLAQYPYLAKRLQQELDEVLGGRSPTMEDFPKLTYTRMLLDESLRLYPPSWCVSREAIGPDVVGGCEIPAGAQMIIGTYAVHHDPKVWADPEVPRPERFDPKTASHHRFAYLPFGGGPRLCIGDMYALTEISLILALVAQRLRFHHAPGSWLEAQAHLGLRPKVPIRLFAEPRKSPAAN